MTQTLLLDKEGEIEQTVNLAQPWELVTSQGLLTVDDILGADESQWLAWADDPLTTYEQQVAMLSILTDPAVEAYARLRRYRHNPVGFVNEVLGEYVWSKQREILNALVDHRLVAVPSCHASGKSFTAARVVAWWLATHAPGDAFVVTTAPTGDQVRGILWREINRAHASGRLPGRTNLAQWYIGNELVALGRKPADTNPAAFQGLHARYLLVVIDEADGVHANIFDATRTLTTTKDTRVLAIGNPDLNSGRFYDACLPGTVWKVIRISAFETPNFTDEKEVVPPHVLASLVDQSFVDDIITDPHFGISSPRYKSKVLALPPDDTPDAVMPLARIRDCMPYPDEKDRKVRWNPDTLELICGQELGPVEVGIDVGGEGSDLTVCRERRGAVLGRVLRLNDPDPMREVGKIVHFLRLCGATQAKIDSIGVGYGVMGRLRELNLERAHPARIIGVNVGEAGKKSTSRRPGFPKKRDQLWWEVGRGNTMGQEWDLSCLYDEEKVLPELFQPTYEELSNGQIKIEGKKEMRARLGRSPDDADAILLAYYKRTGMSMPGAGQLENARL